MSLALLFYIALNYFAFYSRSNAPAAMLMTYIMLPAYLLWYLFMGKKPIQFNKHKITIAVFLLCTFLISTVHPYPASILPFADFLTFSLIISILIGLLFGLKVKRKLLAVVLAFISGIIGSLLTGLLTGHFFGLSLFGTTGLEAVFAGVLFFSGWGYFIALYEIGGCIIGILLLRIYRNIVLTH